MSAFLSAMQVGLYSKLTGATGVTNIVSTRIYDQVRPDATFPYLAIQPIASLPFDTKTTEGTEAQFQITAWSRSDTKRGMKEAQDIAAAVYTALHRQSVSVAGATFVDCRHLDTNILQDGDGLTWAAVLRFTIIARE